MSLHDFEERRAIAEVDGELDPADAYEVAVSQFAECARDDAPDVWDKLNRRWRAAVVERHGEEKALEAHEALKNKHVVDTFTALTVGQIWASVQRLENTE